MVSSIIAIREKQEFWAKRQNISVDKKGYTRNLKDNLFQKMNENTENEFASGDGAELKQKSGRRKMQALHSSSALACNFFDYWRGRDTSALAAAMNLPSRICNMQFERKLPSGVKPRFPNLDLTLECTDGTLVGIESKFCEPYRRLRHRPLADKYFSVRSRQWISFQLPACQRLAELLRKPETMFTHLDATQLLKHFLGLANASRNWILLYVWYSTNNLDAASLYSELAGFQKMINSDGAIFTFLTYQEIFSALRIHAVEHSAYLAYLRNRYFLDV